MKRLWALAGILILGLAPAGGPAQGLLGSNWPALAPSLISGSNSCGPNCLGPVFYVGYTYDPGNPTIFSADARAGTPAGLASPVQHYDMRGVWLRLSQAVPINDSFGIIAWGWYLVLGHMPYFHEPYDYNVIRNRFWSSLKTEWWCVDALAVRRNLNSFSLLGGSRYDRFSTKFCSPFQTVGLPPDRADVTSTGHIPLAGARMAGAGTNYKLLFRVIGCPLLIGHVRHSEGVAGGTNVEASGSYRGTGFLAVFAEYGYRSNERSTMGLFARFNSTRGIPDLTLEPHPLAAAESHFDMSVSRNS